MGCGFFTSDAGFIEVMRTDSSIRREAESGLTTLGGIVGAIFSFVTCVEGRLSMVGCEVVVLVSLAVAGWLTLCKAFLIAVALANR